MASPVVSVIVANFNGARLIEAALGSALRQTLGDIEVIVGDDGSSDDSLARVQALAGRDRRLRLLPPSCNLGPAAARNRCIEEARGTWLAVLDSDDLMHPERLERLVAAATRDDADIAADNLLIFDDDQRRKPTTCMSRKGADAPYWVDLVSYVRANAIFRRGAVLGYLKPLLRRELLARSGVRYDPSLRIGEDYDLIARLLARGARFRVYPDITYFYRRHVDSISHRLSRPALDALLAANDRFRTGLLAPDPRLERALEERAAILRRVISFDDLAGAIKRRRWWDAATLACRRPGAAALLRLPLLAWLGRMVRPRPASRAIVGTARSACVISRQRVTGRINGSSAYLLGLCDALAGRSLALHLVCPTPAVFGRRPVLRLRPEMAVFRSVAIRGSLRLGRWFIATDPRVWLRATRGVIGGALRRLGFASERLTRPAPYAIAAPWARRDLLFLASQARGHADLILADYAFLASAIPYVLRPESPSAVVMHDLFASRTAQFERLGAEDSVAAIDLDAEMRLLGQADAVIAIQRDEAEIVRAHLPGRHVLLAPMAVTPVAAPQPGAGCDILFVGSKTAPNVLGMRWFVDEIWDLIRRLVPEARLVICGGVGSALGHVPGCVETIGYAPDLAALYRRAAVVIAPLPVGSGLKIKLVEALGHGKAVVATSATMQGVEDDARAAVLLADQADAFAAAVISLLRDEALRTQHAVAALAAARRRYTADTCNAELLDFVARHLPAVGTAAVAGARRLPRYVNPAAHHRPASANEARS